VLEEPPFNMRYADPKVRLEWIIKHADHNPNEYNEASRTRIRRHKPLPSATGCAVTAMWIHSFKSTRASPRKGRRSIFLTQISSARTVCSGRWATRARCC
jgi:hypothetical protein